MSSDSLSTLFNKDLFKFSTWAEIGKKYETKDCADCTSYL